MIGLAAARPARRNISSSKGAPLGARELTGRSVIPSSSANSASPGSSPTNNTSTWYPRASQDSTAFRWMRAMCSSRNGFGALKSVIKVGSLPPSRFVHYSTSRCVLWATSALSACNSGCSCTTVRTSFQPNPSWSGSRRTTSRTNSKSRCVSTVQRNAP